MKKTFALFLVFACLFLTACNQNPPVGPGTSGGTDATGESVSSDKPAGSDQPQDPAGSVPKDMIVCHVPNGYIDLPSRVMFEMGVASGKIYNVYYSKADGETYPYCFDPLCDHSGGKCLAYPSSWELGSFYPDTTCFINDRFYLSSNSLGKIVSFHFDGTDMKIEYDAGYQRGDIPNGPWTPNIEVYGSYIYLDQREAASEDGKKHLLRFNTETKEMEDLTEKTGNYIWPSFFYNGEMYGQDTVWNCMKASPDLTVCETAEEFRFSPFFYGSKFMYPVQDEKYNTLGIGCYDVETGEEKMLSNEALGIPEGGVATMIAMDENYIYYVNNQKLLVGYTLHPKTGAKISVYKYNDGKIFRANHDGTGAACIYDDPDMTYNDSQAIVFDGKNIIIHGNSYCAVEGETEGLVKQCDAGYYVGTFREDGTIGEWKLIQAVY
ncbi:MAG: hypothetical protein IJD59_09755 [Clostridia bacterium]|nr:hypothetical protein [Clostridia bacterium]